MEAAAAPHLQLARALPPRLLRFFARNPPRIANGTLQRPTEEVPEQSEDSPSDQPLRPAYYNPFLPHKHPKSGRWHPPIYSARRQSELVKLAKKHDVEDLLPYTPKLSDEKLKRQEEHGLRVKGTGAGQKVKGHEWERTLKGRMEKRRQAMMNMPALVQTWKQVSGYSSCHRCRAMLIVAAWARTWHHQVAVWQGKVILCLSLDFGYSSSALATTGCV